MTKSKRNNKKLDLADARNGSNASERVRLARRMNVLADFIERTMSEAKELGIETDFQLFHDAAGRPDYSRFNFRLLLKEDTRIADLAGQLHADRMLYKFLDELGAGLRDVHYDEDRGNRHA